MCALIGNIRESKGHGAAEEMAERVTQIINDSQTEAEILEKIKAL